MNGRSGVTVVSAEAKFQLWQRDDGAPGGTLMEEGARTGTAVEAAEHDDGGVVESSVSAAACQRTNEEVTVALASVQTPPDKKARLAVHRSWRW